MQDSGTLRPISSVMQQQILDGLAEALGRIVAAKVKEFDQAMAVREAETKAFQAELRLQVSDALALVAARLAKVKDGEPGPAGPEGPPGAQGKPGIDGSMGPAGPQGGMGPEGPAGPAGAKGEAGRDGMPGRDGMHGLQGERGKDGRDGVDGKDGVGFESWRAEYDGERLVRFICGHGEHVKSYGFTMPIPIYRGWWSDGLYARGDEVSHAGNIYRAMQDTDGKPGHSDDWQVAVNRGRDGRDGKDGMKGDPGPEGRPGRDLTQIGPDGKKW